MDGALGLDRDYQLLLGVARVLAQRDDMETAGDIRQRTDDYVAQMTDAHTKQVGSLMVRVMCGDELGPEAQTPEAAEANQLLDDLVRPYQRP